MHWFVCLPNLTHCKGKDKSDEYKTDKYKTEIINRILNGKN